MASSAARQHSVKATSVTWMLFVSCCWSERSAGGDRAVNFAANLCSGEGVLTGTATGCDLCSLAHAVVEGAEAVLINTELTFDIINSNGHTLYDNAGVSNYQVTSCGVRTETFMP